MIESARLFLDSPGRDSIDRLTTYIEFVKQTDTLAPVTVIGPSTYANLSLRHQIGRTGFANVRFLVLPRLSEFLGAPSLASLGRSPLTPMLERAAVRVVSEEARGTLADLRNHPATHSSLRSTFRELRYATDDALNRLRDHSDLRREVVRLYRRFRQITSKHYDREDLAKSAANAVKSGQAGGLNELGFIVFYQIKDVTPAERGMIEALGEQGNCAVFLGLTGDPEADAPVKGLASRLAETFGDPVERSNPPIESDTRLIIAPDPHQEVSWVIRSIMKKAETGVPFHRMAVIYRKRDPYARLVPEEFQLARLPIAGPNPGVFADTAVGRTLTGLMELSEQGDLSRETVMNWIADCPVRPPGIPRNLYSPSVWDAVSRKAGIVRGPDQWAERLERHAVSSSRSAERAERLGEISDQRSTQMRSEAEAAKNLSKFIQNLAGDIVPPDDGSLWHEFAGWARELLGEYLVPESELSDAELAALLSIREKLDEMTRVDDLQSGPTLTAFSEALKETLQDGLGHMGATGQGVFVAPFGAVATMSFDTVYMVGMIEGSVPPPAADDPLIPDRDRREAGGPSAGLALQDARRADERYAFLAALTTAPHRILSFPRADPVGQRGYYPSRWFLDQAADLEGEPIYTSTIWALADRPWLTVIPSMERSLATVEQGSAVDLHDYVLERLWSWRRAELRVADHPLAKSGHLARTMALGRRRNSRRLTEWDGDISAVAQDSTRISSMNKPVHSPTSLERWARCPYSYYLGNVLGITAVEKPEEIMSMTPLDKGILIHDILEKFFKSVLADGSMPHPGDRWDRAHLVLLHYIAEDALADAEGRGVTGRRLLWEMEKADIVSDLEMFLEHDSRFRERFNVTPWAVEAQFGFGGDSWKEVRVELSDGRIVRFRGVIDRLEIDDSGKRVLVTDYKTGSASPFDGLKKDVLDGGRKLQLPVYSMAVKQQLGNDVRVSAAYWFITSRGKFALLPSEPMEIDEVSDRFRDVVSTITAGIGSGLFPANPGSRGYGGGFDNCRYCDFDRLCPSRRDTAWERKKADPRLADYLKLSESGESEG